jgi:nitroreductase
MGRSLPEIRMLRISDISRPWRERSPEGALYEICHSRFHERSAVMFLSLIQKRRSIRKFKHQKVEPDKVALLVEAALRAPSSMGSNPWEFIIITDQAVLEKLSKAKPHGATFLQNAPLGIVVCANPEKSDVWVEDASIAAVFIQLSAESLGLGSCWIQLRERMHDKEKTSGAYVLELLQIPDVMKVECIIAIGYPDESKSPHRKENLEYHKIHMGLYGKPFKM